MEVSPALEAVALWDAKACARYLKKSPRWIYAALTRTAVEPGSIPHVRVGRSPRFIPEDVEAWVRQGCPPAASFQQWREAEQKRNKRR